MDRLSIGPTAFLLSLREIFRNGNHADTPMATTRISISAYP